MRSWSWLEVRIKTDSSTGDSTTLGDDDPNVFKAANANISSTQTRSYSESPVRVLGTPWPEQFFTTYYRSVDYFAQYNR